MSWWPYGQMAENLAHAVHSGDHDLAQRYAEEILEESERMKRFEPLEQALYQAAEGCRWDECDRLLEELVKVGILDTSAVVQCQTMVSFERGTTVLDRIAERINQDDCES